MEYVVCLFSSDLEMIAWEGYAALYDTLSDLLLGSDTWESQISARLGSMRYASKTDTLNNAIVFSVEEARDFERMRML